MPNSETGVDGVEGMPNSEAGNNCPTVKREQAEKGLQARYRKHMCTRNGGISNSETGI